MLNSDPKTLLCGTAVHFLEAAERNDARKSSTIKALHGIARTSAARVLISERALKTLEMLHNAADRFPATGDLFTEPLSEKYGEIIRLILSD
jgi:hypothetical protein